MSEAVVKHRFIPEHVIKGKRLGRHVEHDSRSRDHVAQMSAAPLVKVRHKRHGGVLDQGDLGSCTGNAAVGAVNTEPVFIPHKHTKLLHEKDALDVYSLATGLDEIPGSYPPDDTGSTGLSAAKAAQQLHFIGSYTNAFGIDQALAALQIQSVITGVNWYEGFDTPDANGFITIQGQIRGAHEFEVAEYLPNVSDPLNAVVGCWQSWGITYAKRGKFYMLVKTWAQLLEQEGDVTVLVP